MGNQEKSGMKLCALTSYQLAPLPEHEVSTRSGSYIALGDDRHVFNPLFYRMCAVVNRQLVYFATGQ